MSFWQDRHVLVTGGASFIGSHLVEALVERGAKVRIVDDLSSGKLENVQQHLTNGTSLSVNVMGKRLFLKRSLEQFYYNPSQALWRATEAELYSELRLISPILDIGCGDGSFAKAAFDFKIDYACDIARSDIKAAKESGMYSNCIVSDACGLPFRDGCFETVFSNCVLEHIPKVDLVLDEVSRVLRSGGAFIFSVPSDKFWENAFLYNLLKRINLGLAESFRERTDRRLAHFHYCGAEEWEKKLLERGIQLIEVKSYMSKSKQRVWELIDEFFCFGRGRFRAYRLLMLVGRRISKKYLVKGFYLLL